MTTPSKHTTRKPSPKRPSTKPGPSPKAFLRFYYPEALHRKTLSLIGAIEQAEDATAYREDLAALVEELTKSGMDYYFMKPLRLAKPGFLTEQSASLGLASVQRIMGTVIHQIIGRMDGPQLLSICGSIRQLMH